MRIEPSKDEIELSNKQLADCIESLIGASYKHGGLEMAKDLLKHFGIIGSYPVEYLINQGRKEFKELEVILGYKFNNPGILGEALTHTTVKKAYNYDRLEYLGDALIDFIIIDYFSSKYPTAGPGSLSKMKATAVSNRTFSYVSHELFLHEYLEYAGSELKSDLLKFRSNISKLGGIENLSKLPDTGIKVMADMFESVIAAIYIDSRDLEFCKRFAIEKLSPLIDRLNPENCNLHPHNRLFDFAQRNKKVLGNIKIERFKVDKRSGIEFVTKVSVQEKVVAEGRGPSKLASSEMAADNFFSKYGNR